MFLSLTPFRLVFRAWGSGLRVFEPDKTKLWNTSSLACTRFPSRPLIIRVPFFLLFGFHKGTQKEKG